VIWAIDFEFDELRLGEPVKFDSKTNKHTHEPLVGVTDESNASEKVIDHVKKIIGQREAPIVLRCFRGHEFIVQAFDENADGKLRT
jgi:hypothetical protein